MALDAQWSAVARGYRNAVVLAAVLGLVSLVVAYAAGEWLVGPFLCVGLALGAWNARKLWSDTTSMSAEAVTDGRRKMMVVSLRRLGVITVFALLVALLYRADGWAVFVGLVVFQLEMMAMLLRPLRKVVAA